MFIFSMSNILILSQIIFGVGYIQSGNLFPEPLSAEEEKRCLEKLKQGDDEARNILIERNLRLVAHVAKKYGNANVDQDDLISIGTIGLIKGINSFDVEKGSRLSTYVSRCIDNEIVKVGDVVIVKYNGEISEDNYVTGAYSINKGTLVESEPVILE